MKILSLGRYAFSICAAAAMLADCNSGALQSVLSPSAGVNGAGQVRFVQGLARRYRVVFRFHPSDGEHPRADLIVLHGTLYGTTYSGGANRTGTVFSLTTAGTESVLHSFAGTIGSGDGAYPAAALTALHGTLYGTTPFGGGSNGDGTVFSVTTGGTERAIYSFQGGDGAYPRASLTAVNGTLYGTTNEGGANGYGAVFRVTTAGKERTLYSFKGGSDGAYPYARLIDVGGTLYGTTIVGGARCGYGQYPYGCGTVFSISTNGVEKVLYSFAGGSDGALPSAGLIDVGGTLYGTTGGGSSSGDGTVYSISTSGAEKVLYSFAGGSDGAQPGAGLVNVKGTLYGTTSSGGPSDNGTVFSISTSGEERVLYRFRGGSDGASPNGLIYMNGTLYGTTIEGGTQGKGKGTVFALTP
ncbi:MAG TPA: choice-of-anchor tandem repeat GloVer-containing protein [Candidatus Cybelea sp.]